MNSLPPRLNHALLALAIVIVGLLSRWPSLGLPWLISKYAGFSLWAAAIYALSRTPQPRARIATTVLVASGIAIGAEFTRLYHQPDIDAFRLTLAGKLLLGRLFAYGDMVAYLAGIACVAPRRGERLIASGAFDPGTA
jgi:heme/copper-type cytochrome/quinol oxidase subunit 3